MDLPAREHHPMTRGLVGSTEVQRGVMVGKAHDRRAQSYFSHGIIEGDAENSDPPAVTGTWFKNSSAYTQVAHRQWQTEVPSDWCTIWLSPRYSPWQELSAPQRHISVQPDEHRDTQAGWSLCEGLFCQASLTWRASHVQVLAGCYTPPALPLLPTILSEVRPCWSVELAVRIHVYVLYSSACICLFLLWISAKPCHCWTQGTELWQPHQPSPSSCPSTTQPRSHG